VLRARADETEPLPVILNLVSWAEKRHRLDSWIVEELTAKYQIPRPMARQWLEDDELILLLDGLDEVARRQQAACIQALNQFRQTYGLAGIVVCSRLDDYEAREQPLKLSGSNGFCGSVCPPAINRRAMATATVAQRPINRAKSSLLSPIYRAYFSSTAIYRRANINNKSNHKKR
jgi:hypothetical protein